VGALDGKVAIITGSGRGIGRGMALLFAQEGAKVVVVDPGVNVDGTGTDAGPADQVVAEIVSAGGEAVPCYESVATAEGGEKIVQTALDAFGRLDILVNNAGILRDRMIFNMTEEEWDAVIAVHLKGHFCCTKPASIVFRQQRSGRIINFSSTARVSCAPARRPAAVSRNRRRPHLRRRASRSSSRRWPPTWPATTPGTSTATSSPAPAAASPCSTTRRRCARSGSRRCGRWTSSARWCRAT
jgi:NAD(P)-dependent dehydrogenase (short-subunit alcohol dehydrogenase family)